MSPPIRLGTIWRLRIAYLILGMMFFYGVEQLFLDKYLHNASARGYLTTAFAVSLVVFDVPMGILADRVGRKICLLGACLAQMASLIVMGLSSSLVIYLIGAVLFGLYISLFNGASQAYLYDWLAVRSKTALYARYQGSMYAWWIAGSGLANLLSGFIARAYGLRSIYFLSVVPGAVAFWLLSRLVEPPLQKQHGSVWYTHVGEAFQELRAHRRIISFAIQFMAAGIILLTIGEFGQLYILSFGVSTVLLGVYWAIDAAFAAGGRAMAHRLQARPRLTIVVFCIVLAVFAMVHSALGIGLFWLVYGLNEALANIAETEIQDSTSTHIRATMLSLVSFAGNALAVPIILLFNTYYRNHGILAANRLIAIVVIITLLVTLYVRPPRIKNDGLSVRPPGAELIG